MFGAHSLVRGLPRAGNDYKGVHELCDYCGPVLASRAGAYVFQRERVFFREQDEGSAVEVGGEFNGKGAG